MRHARIDGLEVAFQCEGAGRSLVLLHGILADSRAWQQQLDGLSDDFRILAWDAPGCGWSADPPDHWRLPEYADCLAELVATVGLVDPIVAGLSWGGGLALAFQQRHPGVASSLVVSGGYAGWAGSLPEDVRDARLAACLAQVDLPADEVIAAWLPGFFTAAASAELRLAFASIMADFHPVGFRTMALAIAEADLRAGLPAIDVPVLLLYGDDDQRAPAATVGAALAAQLPRGRLEVIPAAGHVCNVEQPQAFNAAIRRFAALEARESAG